MAPLEPLEMFRFMLNRNISRFFCYDAFSSREPAPTSLENAMDEPLRPVPTELR
jgi:hypothetical protein